MSGTKKGAFTSVLLKRGMYFGYSDLFIFSAGV